MKQYSTVNMLYSFRSYSISMVIFSILLFLMVILEMIGVALPFEIGTLESTSTIRIISMAACGVGLIGGLMGINAAKNRRKGAVKVCAFLGIVIILLFTAMTILSENSSNVHVWIAFGAFAIIPGGFCGQAIMLSGRNWEDGLS